MSEVIVILIICGCVLLYTTRRLYKAGVVLLVFVAQFLWWALPHLGHGQTRRFYRRVERHETYLAWYRNPTAETKAAKEAEDTPLASHISSNELALLLVTLVMDGAVLGYYWTQGNKLAPQSTVRITPSGSAVPSISARL
jgi:hypothetical protein